MNVIIMFINQDMWDKGFINGINLLFNDRMIVIRVIENVVRLNLLL